MSFKKGTRLKDVAVIVPEPWGGVGEYTFYFAKRPPKEALDAGETYFATVGEERTDEKRKALVRAVAALCARPPEGFEDFPVVPPAASEEERLKLLREAALDYFDDPEEPDLEKILAAAWSWYLNEATPRAYLKSAEDSRPRDGQLSGVPVEAPPAV